MCDLLRSAAVSTMFSTYCSDPERLLWKSRWIYCTWVNTAFYSYIFYTLQITVKCYIAHQVPINSCNRSCFGPLQCFLMNFHMLQSFKEAYTAHYPGKESKLYHRGWQLDRRKLDDLSLLSPDGPYYTVSATGAYLWHSYLLLYCVMWMFYRLQLVHICLTILQQNVSVYYTPVFVDWM